MSSENTVKHMYIASRKMNRKLFTELVLRAKGDDRSLTEFAKLCHVSTSTLTRIVNGDNTRASSVEVLRTISENASEGSGVTFDNLMAANGYARVEMIDAEDVIGKKRQSSVAMSGVQSFLESFSADGNKMEVRDKRSIHSKVSRILQNTGKKRSTVYQEIVQNYIQSRGHSIRTIQSKQEMIEFKDSTVPFDFIIGTDSLPDDLKSWVFFIMDFNLGDADIAFYEVFYLLYQMQPKAYQYKYTILIGQKKAFEKLCAMLRNALIRDPFSIILIDEKRMKVVEEYVPT